jgi:cytochrome c-type biogenesis protein
MLGTFIAGIVTFLSPCIVPLMPIYISYLTGNSLDDVDENPKEMRKTILIHSIAFLFGLMIVFSLLGLTATAIGRFLYLNAGVFRQISGMVIIVFGLYHTGLIKINFLNKERKMRFKVRKPKLINSTLMGMAFSFGWTPCIGPVIGAILLLAANSETLWSGVWLLIIYSIGFSIPFIITALFLNEILKRFDKASKHVKVIKMITGLIIIIVGGLIMFNYLDRIASLFY